MTPEIVALIQTGKISNLDGMPPGGVPFWTGSTAAAECSGMPDLTYKVGRLIYGHDWTCLQQVIDEIMPAALRLAKRERWKAKKPSELVKNMLTLSVLDTMGYRGARINFRQAQFLGIDHRGYERYWRKRYQAIYDILEIYVSDFRRHINNKLLTTTQK
jgi:hypothetical protein